MYLQKENCIGIVVDVQEKLLPHIHDCDRCVAAVARLVRGLKILQVPVLAVQLYTKGLGETVAPLRGLLEGSPLFEKIAFSCCAEPAILRELKLSGRRCVIVAGFESHACVLQTILDLLVRSIHPRRGGGLRGLAEALRQGRGDRADAAGGGAHHDIGVDPLRAARRGGNGDIPPDLAPRQGSGTEYLRPRTLRRAARPTGSTSSSCRSRPRTAR